jgi:hypothetical protein
MSHDECKVTDRIGRYEIHKQESLLTDSKYYVVEPDSGRVVSGSHDSREAAIDTAREKGGLR